MFFQEILSGRAENTAMINVKLFGIARDIVGESTLKVAEDINNVAELLEYIRATYPDFVKLTSLLVAVNEQYAELTDRIQENDEVALIPPVSGG